MVRVCVERNGEGLITGFTGGGHALYAPHGEDIVCAAISMLLQTTLLGLIEVLGVEVDYRREEGYLTCTLPADPDQIKQSQVLLETMVLGLKQIAENYGDHFVLEQEEV